MPDYKNDPIIQQVMQMAKEAHEKVGQTYGGKPYFDSHVMAVFDIACKYIHLIPIEDRIDVLAAVLLHDVLEDCPTVYTYNDLVNKLHSIFDNLHQARGIGDMVFAVTNETGKTRNERANKRYYKKIKNTQYADYIKACDRLGNAIESSNGGKMSGAYVREYAQFKKKVYRNYKYAPIWHELDKYLLPVMEEALILPGQLVTHKAAPHKEYVLMSISVFAIEGLPPHVFFNVKDVNDYDLPEIAIISEEIRKYEKF